MRFLLCFLIYLGITPLFGQIVAEKKVHDFGELYPNATSYVDIKFENKTGKKQYLLTIDKPRDVYYRYSAKLLLPDSSIVIRLKVNDGRKGRFNHSVDIYFSDSNKPTTIRLTGNVKEVARNPLTECPDFSKDPPDNGRYEFAVTVKVIDSLTREPIRRAKVSFVQSNSLVGHFYTNKDGIVHREVPMGYYLIAAEKELYYGNFKTGYLNFQRNYVEIELQQPPVEEEPELAEVPEEEPDEIVINIEPEQPEEPDEIVINVEPETPREETEEPEIDTVTTVEPPEPEYVDDTPFSELPDTLFDLAHFKKNNITFILDVSSSMNSSGKLDLLKLSMIELVEFLRPNDLVSVINYSSNVSVLAEGKSGRDKEEIIERVNQLRTSSSTAGGDAIRVAYRMNNAIYEANRNNIVIMITDGAFNKGSKNYLETIAKNYNERGIIFSVVGIKTSQYITSHMQGIVSEGGGDFIQIRTLEDAQTKLIQEIRRTSFRGR